MPKTRRRFTSEFKSEAVRLDRAYERNGQLS
jgi:transposase-like protein